MTLKSALQNFLVILLLFVMAWNTFGWVGLGLYTMHLHHIEDTGEYCSLDFCYCEVDDAGDICTCHHPEIHAYMAGADATEGNSSPHSFCFYSPSHHTSDWDMTLITWTKSVTVFLSGKPLPPAPSFENLYPSASYNLLAGFRSDVLRPPMA